MMSSSYLEQESKENRKEEKQHKAESISGEVNQQHIFSDFDQAFGPGDDETPEDIDESTSFDTSRAEYQPANPNARPSGTRNTFVADAPEDLHGRVPLSQRQAVAEALTHHSNPDNDAGDEEYEDEDEDEDEDEEYVEEEEPRLKYQRIGGNLPKILKEDSIRSLCVHPKFLVAGTDRGCLHQLDLSGNEVLRLQCHSAPIFALDIDSKADVVVTCSADRSAVVTNLYSREQQRITYAKSIHSVQINPSYNETQTFVAGVGTGELTLNAKAWFGNRDTVLHSGEGRIRCIAWSSSGTLLAWSNDVGVKVIDPTNDQRVAFVPRPKHVDPQTHPCSLRWCPAIPGVSMSGTLATLFISWGNVVRVGEVRTRVRNDKKERFLQIMASFETDYTVCGVAPLGENLIILAYPDKTFARYFIQLAAQQREETRVRDQTGQYLADAETQSQEEEEDTDSSPPRPELRIVTYKNAPVASDALPVVGFEYNSHNDYHIEYLPGHEPLYYIVSPKDLVLARQRDTDDRITWLLSCGRLNEAYTAAVMNAGQLRHHKISVLGNQLLEHLLQIKAFDLFAVTCPRVLQDNAVDWAYWINTFANIGQIRTLAPFIPAPKKITHSPTPSGVSSGTEENGEKSTASSTGVNTLTNASNGEEKPLLEEVTYTQIIISLLREDDLPMLLSTIRAWPSTIYSLSTITNAVLAQLEACGINISSDSTDSKENGSSTETSGADLENGNSLTSQPKLLPLRVKLLLETAGELLLLSRRATDALRVFLLTGRDDILTLISSLNLFDEIRHRLLLLAQSHPESSVRLFIDNTDRLLPEEVVQQLSPAPRVLHLYLDSLHKHSPNLAAPYHRKQISLYAQFAPTDLLRFLSSTNNYPLEDALAITEEYRLYECQVFLLRRMGNNGRALSILVDVLQDVPHSLQLAAETKDPALWNLLISRATSSPEFLGEILDSAGDYGLDVKQLIRQLPESASVPRARERMIKLLRGQEAQQRISHSAMAIAKTCMTATQRIGIRKRACGVVVGQAASRSHACFICNEAACATSSYQGMWSTAAPRRDVRRAALLATSSSFNNSFGIQGFTGNIRNSSSGFNSSSGMTGTSSSSSNSLIASDAGTSSSNADGKAPVFFGLSSRTSGTTVSTASDHADSRDSSLLSPAALQTREQIASIVLSDEKGFALPRKTSRKDRLCVFFCGHVIHEECLPSVGYQIHQVSEMGCPLCTEKHAKSSTRNSSNTTITASSSVTPGIGSTSVRGTPADSGIRGQTLGWSGQQAQNRARVR